MEDHEEITRENQENGYVMTQEDRARPLQFDEAYPLPEPVSRSVIPSLMRDENRRTKDTPFDDSNIRLEPPEVEIQRELLTEGSSSTTDQGPREQTEKASPLTPIEGGARKWIFITGAFLMASVLLF